MDGFEFNKIAGALLGTLLLVMLIGISAEAIFHVEEPETPGYAIAVAEEGGAETAVEEVVVASIAERMQTADAAQGERGIRACTACHSFEEGGPAKVGPNLWGVVAGPIAHVDGFGYSGTLTDLHNAGETWTYENLDGFLENPRAWAPGTAMGFNGISDPEARANVIAYLRSLSADPAPLPTVEAAPEAAPAEGEATAEAAPAEAAPAEAAPAEGEPAIAPEGDAPSATPEAAAPAPAH